MKRLSPDDSSLDALIPICPNTTDEECNNPMLQAMLEEEEECGDGRIVVEKKRRLGVDQVRALEKNFEVENKLEPERKVKLAQELGLQPRQVAVWFQNRRARWKTKQLEKDYGVLKANYDSLKLSFDKLHHENETLLNQIGELKNKVNEETKTRVVKEEGMEDQTPNNNITDEDNETPILSDELLKSHEEEEPTSGQQHQNQIHVSMFFTDHGSSDSSESSAILNEDNANTTAAAVSSYSGSSTRGGLGFLQKQQVSVVYDETHQHPHHHLHQFVKIEEHNFFGEEESCSGLMFSEDQAPTLQHWYSSDEWDLN